MSSSGCRSPPVEDQPANQGYVFPEGKVMPNTIFVGGIDVRMDEIQIKDFFSKYGVVKEVKIITDRSGVSKGYGFVSYCDDVDVQKIVESQINFHGKKLKLGPAIRKQNMCTYVQPRPVVINTPAPPYPSMWSPPVSDPYIQQAPVFSPMTQYMQTCPYPSNTQIIYPIPVGPGYYQYQAPPPPQWPSFVSPQVDALAWNTVNEVTSEILPAEIMSIQEQPVSTSPQKKVDRSIQTVLSGLLNGDGIIQRSFISHDDYYRDRRTNQFRRRPVMKPAFEKAGI